MTPQPKLSLSIFPPEIHRGLFSTMLLSLYTFFFQILPISSSSVSRSRNVCARFFDHVRNLCILYSPVSPFFFQLSCSFALSDFRLILLRFTKCIKRIDDTKFLSVKEREGKKKKKKNDVLAKITRRKRSFLITTAIHKERAKRTMGRSRCVGVFGE